MSLLGGNWPMTMYENFTLGYAPIPDDWAGVLSVKHLSEFTAVKDLEAYSEVIDWLQTNIKNVENNVWCKGFGYNEFVFRRKADMTWFILRFSS